MARPPGMLATKRDRRIDHAARAHGAIEAMDVLIARGAFDHPADLLEATIVAQALRAYHDLARELVAQTEAAIRDRRSGATT